VTEEGTTRKRGRPRKVDAAVEANPVEVTPTEVVAVEDENAAMQEQIKYQLVQLLKLAQKAGLDLEELYPTPPKEDTVVLELEEEETVDSYAARPHGGRLQPGTVLAGGNWVPWRKEDLDQSNKVEFVPAPVPSLVFPMTDEDGRQKIRLDVNDLVCWLTVGVSNHVNRFFYNAYMDAYNSWKELEYFKRHGPEYAPWGRTGPDGRPAWHFEPFALTAGMDIDGRYLVAGRSPLYQAQQENEEAI
jgi:hypothetical protein